MLTLSFDPNGAPLYAQLYAALVEELRSGRMRAGERLPSKRALAAHLQVSLNTVDAAYQMLVSEGYLEARPRSGYFACPPEPMTPPPPRPAAPPTAAPARDGDAVRYDLTTRSVDTAFFPFKTWAKLSREVLSGGAALLNHGEQGGDGCLRRAVARYLHEFRGVRCDASQVFLGAGTEYLLGLLAPLLSGAVAVEDPGYPKTADVLQNSGATISHLPVDDRGLSVEALRHSGCTAAYVTPSHQFPTGVTMPVGRRAELLRWACEEEGRYIIEDDYDSEFRFDGRPIPAMQGLDEHGHVIYLSTFSRSLAPSMRIAYMVLPQGLLARFRARYGAYASTVSRFEQHTLARFLDDGHFARHLNRVRSVYRARKDALTEALLRELPRDRVEICCPNTGLHLPVRLSLGLEEDELQRRAAQAGVRVSVLSRYEYTPRAHTPTLILGYSAPAADELRDAVRALAAAFR